METLDEQILENIEREKAWEFVELDNATLKICLGRLRSSVNGTRSQKLLEI